MFPNNTRLHSGVVVEQADVGGYFIDFIKGGQDLVISFENAEPTIARGDGLRDAWGFKFLTRLGYSVLGIKPKALDWYRGAALHEWFRSDEFHAFSAGFRRVIFMGGSMGGYGAATFSRIVPGSVVVAFNPQSSLDPRIAGWDPRYPHGTKQDWTGDFADAADAIALAKRVYICYDPFDRMDLRHLKRLEQPNVEHLKMPFLGHTTPTWLRQMGLLEQTSAGAMAETLTSQIFAKWLRKRRTLPHYYINASRRLTSAGRHAAAVAAATKGARLYPNQKDVLNALDAAQKASLRTINAPAS